MSRNEYKKITSEDKFARKYFCKHTRLGYIRTEKRRNRKKMREYNKKLVEEQEEIFDDFDEEGYFLFYE